MMTKETRQRLGKLGVEQEDLRLLVNNLRKRVEDLELAAQRKPVGVFGLSVSGRQLYDEFQARLKAASVRGAALFTVGQRVRNQVTYDIYETRKRVLDFGHPAIERARLIAHGVVIPRPVYHNGLPTASHPRRVWVLCDDKRVRYTNDPDRLVRL